MIKSVIGRGPDGVGMALSLQARHAVNSPTS
jgi:hypothetical protein